MMIVRRGGVVVAAILMVASFMIGRLWMPVRGESNCVQIVQADHMTDLTRFDTGVAFTSKGMLLFDPNQYELAIMPIFPKDAP